MSKISMAAVLLLGLIGYVRAQSANEGFVMDSEGIQHLISHPEPVYPPIAKTLHLQGTVLLHVGVDATGTVTKVDVLGGPPMLRAAAIDAVKKWTYRPFEVNGQAAAVQVVVSVPFSLGIPAAEEKTDEAIGQAYFPKFDECNALNSAGNWADAVRTCGDAVAIAARFPNQTSRANEIRTAHLVYGEALAFSRDLPGAMMQFREAVEVAKGSLTPKDAEYASAYFWLALGEQASQMVADADRDYGVAESSYREAIVSLPVMKATYVHSLARTLTYHAILMEQTGDLERMKAMREEAISLDPHALDGMKGSN